MGLTFTQLRSVPLEIFLRLSSVPVAEEDVHGTTRRVGQQGEHVYCQLDAMRKHTRIHTHILAGLDSILFFSACCQREAGEAICIANPHLPAQVLFLHCI